jgi:hypothetical protein
LNLSLVNSVGQTVITNKQSLPAGDFSTVLNVSNVPPGVYVVKVVLGSKAYGKKVIVVH